MEAVPEAQKKKKNRDDLWYRHYRMYWLDQHAGFSLGYRYMPDTGHVTTALTFCNWMAEDFNKKKARGTLVSRINGCMGLSFKLKKPAVRLTNDIVNDLTSDSLWVYSNELRLVPMWVDMEANWLLTEHELADPNMFIDCEDTAIVLKQFAKMMVYDGEADPCSRVVLATLPFGEVSHDSI